MTASCDAEALLQVRRRGREAARRTRMSVIRVVPDELVPQASRALVGLADGPSSPGVQAQRRNSSLYPLSRLFAPTDRTLTAGEFVLGHSLTRSLAHSLILITHLLTRQAKVDPVGPARSTIQSWREREREKERQSLADLGLGLARSTSTTDPDRAASRGIAWLREPILALGRLATCKGRHGTEHTVQLAR